MLLTNFNDPFKPARKSLCISGGYVVEVDQPFSSEAVADCHHHILLPGLIDLQVYGAAGYIFEEDISKECLQNINNVLLRHGTTGFLITLPSTSKDKIFKAIDVVRETMMQGNTGLLGLHLEGPFISPEKRGAHNPDFIVKPDKEFLKEILSRSGPALRMMTIAPEIFSDELLELILQSEVRLSIGHTTASYEQAQHAFSKGINCCTHLYNAMSQLESRSPGVVGAVLMNERVWSTIVVDGTHVCYETLALTFRLNQDKLMLISDGVFLDVKKPEGAVAGIKVFQKNNRFYTAEGNLAGSNISLLDAVNNCTTHLDIQLQKAVEMASSRPAHFLDLKDQGSIDAGVAADLILVDKSFQIKGVMFKGKWMKHPEGNLLEEQIK